MVRWALSEEAQSRGAQRNGPSSWGRSARGKLTVYGKLRMVQGGREESGMMGTLNQAT